MIKYIDFIVWVIIPLLNFFYWYLISKNQLHINNCQDNNEYSILKHIPIIQDDIVLEKIEKPCPAGMIHRSKLNNNKNCHIKYNDLHANPYIYTTNTINYDKYRDEKLASMIYPLIDRYHLTIYIIYLSIIISLSIANNNSTIITKLNENDECKQTYNSYISKQKDFCYAIIRLSDINISYNTLRY
jgi:hypothetical protein